MMKHASIGMVSVGILAVTVGAETANAQSYRRYGPARTYTSQAYTPQRPGSFRREGGLHTTPFSDPNSPEATGGGSLGYNRALPHRWGKKNGSVSPPPPLRAPGRPHAP